MKPGGRGEPTFRTKQFIVQLVEDRRSALNQATAGDLGQEVDLGLYIKPIVRQSWPQRGRFMNQNCGEPKDGDKGDQHGCADCRDPARPNPAKPSHSGRQQEAQQHRQRDWNEDLAGEIKRRDDHARGQDGQRTGKAGSGNFGRPRVDGWR